MVMITNFQFSSKFSQHTFLLDIKFNKFEGSIFIGRWRLITTKPHFNVISSWLWKLLAKPGRVVELTASGA